MNEKKLYEDTKYEIAGLHRALLVGGYDQAKGLSLCVEHLGELGALARTYGLEVVGEVPCQVRRIDPALYFGQGKIEELRVQGEALQAEVLIIDEEISPKQQQNLEKIFQRPVIDRTELILEIFSQRAQTKEAKLQVALAQAHYQLPRLRRLWSHLSRQSSGGGAFLKGEGERQLELDKRLVRKKITQLQREIAEVHHQREVQRRARQRSAIPLFSIIGYTNVGKSTLMRALTQAEVLVEDKLFATLDTTTRKFALPNHQEILLIDTVGFIRKLPHTLVAAFKSTLEEALCADILLHLIDVNHPLAEEHAETTYEVLREMHGDKKPIITVLNKVDLVTEGGTLAKYKLKYPCVVAISALTEEGFGALMQAMMEAVKGLRTRVSLRIPQSEYAVVSDLLREGRVLEKQYEENDILLDVEIPKQWVHKVEDYINDDSTCTIARRRASP